MATISGEVRDDAGDLAADVVVRAYRRDTGALLVSGLSGDDSPEETGDADFASVLFLLHCDGDDESTTITDSGPSARTITAVSGAALSTDILSKFGSACAEIVSSSSKLTVTVPSGSFDNSFTLEMWFYCTDGTGDKSLFSSNNGGGLDVMITGSGTGLKVTRPYIDDIYTGSSLFSLNTWHFIRIVQSATTLKIYTDDTLRFTGTPLTYAAGTVALGGGYYDSLIGYLDEIRLSTVARTETTAPTAAFPAGTIPAKPLGEYTLTTSYTGEVNVIALDPDGGTTFNDLILRTTPV